MSEASPFLSLLTICCFLFCVWSAAKVSRLVGVSPMILEIAVGVILGPGVFQLISPQYEICESRRWVTCEAPLDFEVRVAGGLELPHFLQELLDQGKCADVADAVLLQQCLVRACEQETSEQCERTPDIFTLIGHAGVAMMIFESGMHFDYDKFKVVGAKACGVATIGTMLPLVAGAALVYAFGRPVFPDGIAAGTALAPTSCGVALRLLQEAGALQEEFGQAIMTAAFVDDVLSLILFNVVFSLGAEGSLDIQRTVIFPAAGVAFMIVASFLAVKGWPRLMNKILPKVPEKRGEHKVSSVDEVMLLVMMLTLVSYATMTHYLGNHLWGCYFAGMSFACLEQKEQAHHVWEKQTKRVNMWMIRIFFSCTIAFSIPVDTLLSFSAIWKGILMGAGPCILTKVLSSCWVGHARWAIGWAMVGRAEFNFLIAQMAVTANMLDDEMFSVIIWAFLWATFLAPLVFRQLLKNLMADMELPMKHTPSRAHLEAQADAEGEEASTNADDSTASSPTLQCGTCQARVEHKAPEVHGQGKVAVADLTEAAV